MLPTVASTQRGQSPSCALESSAAPHCSHVRNPFMPIDPTLLPRPFQKKTGRKVTLKTFHRLQFGEALSWCLTAIFNAASGVSKPAANLAHGNGRLLTGHNCPNAKCVRKHYAWHGWLLLVFAFQRQQEIRDQVVREGVAGFMA